jgi:ribosomal protein L37E
MFTKTSDGRFQCVMCYKPVKNKWNFSKHLKSHSKCEKCGKNFAGPRAYNTQTEHVAICMVTKVKKTKKTKKTKKSVYVHLVL